LAASWAPGTCTSKFNEALPGSTPTHVQYKTSDHLESICGKKLPERYDHLVRIDEPNPSRGCRPGAIATVLQLIAMVR